MIDHRIQDEVQNGSAIGKLRSVEPFALISPKHEDSLPNYVQHRYGATEIGKLSAEAVVREYEQ